MAGWLSSAWYQAHFCAAMAGYTLGFSYRSMGSRHVPSTGPVLMLANHQSFLDPVMIGLTVRRPLYYLARKTLFRHHLFGPYLRSVNCIPVDQEGVAKEGIRAVLDRLAEGKAVLVFPEGERTWTGKMQPLKPGVQLIVKKAGCPVLPIGVAGAFEAYPRTAKLPKLAPIFLPANDACVSAAVGPALDGRELANLDRNAMLDRLFNAIASAQRQAEALRRKQCLGAARQVKP